MLIFVNKAVFLIKRIFTGTAQSNQFLTLLSWIFSSVNVCVFLLQTVSLLVLIIMATLMIHSFRRFPSELAGISVYEFAGDYADQDVNGRRTGPVWACKWWGRMG